MCVTIVGGKLQAPKAPRALRWHQAHDPTDPTVVHADEPFTPNLFACNDGTVKSEDFWDMILVDATDVGVEVQDALLPGQCASASHELPRGLSGGHHQILVLIDSYGMVDESNEDNNSQEWDIYIQ